jgi:hypothetical protein
MADPPRAADGEAAEGEAAEGEAAEGEEEPPRERQASEGRVIELEPPSADEADRSELHPAGSERSPETTGTPEPETGPVVQSPRPIRVVHIGEIEARDRMESPARAEPVPDREDDPGGEEPRRRRKLFRKGGHQ